MVSLTNATINVQTVEAIAEVKEPMLSISYHTQKTSSAGSIKNLMSLIKILKLNKETVVF
jgi:hypothetical protein